MKKKIYIETSVVSYYVAKLSKNIVIAGHQASTVGMWKILGSYDVFVSDIVTWNFKHINNPFTKLMIRQIVKNSGYYCPEICSPDELLGDDV